ncbi:hypothetical protein OYE22_27080 [Streptomyces sp. 71268]|uniref:hypothetical protein n=1 Tax=Streptomyces sp. 71268 TaxID=3002640 RepID=UPI0023FA1C5D|nr:hypothetical protein [Streptomyces sp. 71268]WEV28439.1 hypothetical protein OYE22_27080 [Streptomyces sp. 71268]
MADTEQAEDTQRADASTPAADEAVRDAKVERHAARLAKQIDAFARTHGGSAEGQLAHIARGSVRIALVGANGEWGNLVAPSYASAQRAVELAGLTVHEDFGGEFAAQVRTGPYEWSRMAGIQLGGSRNP